MFSDQKELSQQPATSEQKAEQSPQPGAGPSNTAVAQEAQRTRQSSQPSAPDLQGGGAAQFSSSVPVEITASKLRVRTEPTTKTKKNIIGRYARGEQVATFGKKGNWLKVNHQGQEAFIHGRYAKPTKTAPKETKQAAPAPAKQEPGPSVQDVVDTGAALGDAVVDPLSKVAHWFTGLVHKATDGHDEGCDHEDHDDETEVVKNDPVHNEPAKTDNLDDKNQQKTEPAPQPQPQPMPAPAGAAQLKDAGLATYLANLQNGHVDAAAHALAAVEQKSEAMAQGAKDNRNEEKRGEDRRLLVAALAELRAKIGSVGPGLDDAAAAKARAKLYRAAQSIAPYYSQGRNMDILETADNTRTCNLTSLAMCLESMGIGPSAYAGSTSKVVAAAKVSAWAPRVKKAGGGSGSYASLTNMRMPDFLQLCAIAECANGKSSDAMLAGGRKAWDRILSMNFLRKLAGHFGVSGSVHYFTTSTDEEKKGRGHLAGHGKKHRKEAYKLILARNKWEQSGDEKDRKKYEKLKKNAADVLGTGKSKIDQRLPVETYKRSIMEQVGPELDAGKAVLIHMAGHYTRLQSMNDEFIVGDDPGSYKKANMKILWEEARALAYFKSRIVFG